MSVPSPVNESLLSQRLGALGSARSWASNVLPELERFIRTADDYDLFRVNPIQYGGAVDLSEADAIELFVHAAKVGLFEMDWLLICAYCPQVAGSFRELDDKPRGETHPPGGLEALRGVPLVAVDDHVEAGRVRLYNFHSLLSNGLQRKGKQRSANYQGLLRDELS